MVAMASHQEIYNVCLYDGCDNRSNISQSRDLCDNVVDRIGIFGVFDETNTSIVF